MANQIRFKRASGSDPGASDLVLGDPAVRTDTGELFFKKDDGSVAKVSGGGISDGDKGDITVSNSGATFTIDNDAVTQAKIANGAINNARVASNAAIAGSKINPNFGFQALTCGSVDSNGGITGSALQLDSSTVNYIYYTDSLQIAKSGHGTELTIDSSGNIAIAENLDVGAGLDVTGNITVSGTVDGRDVASDGTKLDGIESGATADQSKSDIDALGIAASTAATLATARTIAGVSFDGSANISLNNNAITNGAGYITGSSLNASNLDSGTVDTARLPTTIQHAASITLRSTGSGNDVQIKGEDFVVLTGGIGEDGGIIFRGNSGVDSYRFAKSGQTSIEGFLSFESLSADRTFTFPDTTGTLALTSSDITGNAATATALETARTIGGTSFDGTANITPAECTNADTVDSLHASSFLRSDAADTMSQSTSGTATLTVTNSGGAGSGIGTGAIVAEFNGDSDGVVIRNIAGGDYSIMNDQQNNGFVLYDGTGGVDIVYNGVVRVEFDSGNTYGDFKGTPSVNGTNLALITDVGGGATGGGSDEVFYENDQTVTTNYTITNGKNAMAAGPITINSGVTVTVGSGETLTIV